MRLPVSHSTRPASREQGVMLGPPPCFPACFPMNGLRSARVVVTRSRLRSDNFHSRNAPFARSCSYHSGGSAVSLPLGAGAGSICLLHCTNSGKLPALVVLKRTGQSHPVLSHAIALALVTMAVVAPGCGWAACCTSRRVLRVAPVARMLIGGKSNVVCAEKSVLFAACICNVPLVFLV